MNDERFDLYFKGDLLDGFFVDFVKGDMARLFKTDAARIEPFFSGRAHPVKLNVDKAVAAKYRQALKAIGARLMIVPAGQSPEAAAKPEARESGQSAPRAGVSAPDWSILPPGSDIGEHRDQPSVIVDTSRLSLAQVGAVLDETPQRPEPNPVDTSSLSLGKAGERLGEEDTRPAPQPPDTSHLRLE